MPPGRGDASGGRLCRSPIIPTPHSPSPRAWSPSICHCALFSPSSAPSSFGPPPVFHFSRSILILHLSYRTSLLRLLAMGSENMEVDVGGNLWPNRWHAPLARSCRRLWRHRRLFRHEMRMERRRRRPSELCSARPHCSALNVNVFILGVDSLTTKTAKTMITAALMMVMSRKRRRRRRVRGWRRAQPRKWRRTRTRTDLGTRGSSSASSLWIWMRSNPTEARPGRRGRIQASVRRHYKHDVFVFLHLPTSIRCVTWTEPNESV